MAGKIRFFFEKTKEYGGAAASSIRARIRKCRDIVGKRLSSFRWTKGRAAVLCCAGLVSLFLLVMYGPFKGLSDLYITTAMHTSDHRYLARMFYSDEYINQVLERNCVSEPSSSVSTPVSGERSDSIRVVEIWEDGLSGYLLIVSDPSRIGIVPCGNGGGMLLEDIAEQHGAAAAINASGYISKAQTDVPNGLVIYDHKVVHKCDSDKHSFLAIDDESRLHFGVLSEREIINRSYHSVIDFGPLLILNGEPSEISGYGTGLSARTAIGQTADGEVLLLVVDGMQVSTLGASLQDIQDIMLSHGAVNAISLDGGSSSSMYYNGEIINNPSQGKNGRVIPNAIIVK